MKRDEIMRKIMTKEKRGHIGIAQRPAPWLDRPGHDPLVYYGVAVA
jgi:hypothetical protein